MTTPNYNEGSRQNSSLPIDMQFNDGNLLAIVTYSMLMVISAVGNINVLIAIIRTHRRQRLLNLVTLLLCHLTIADLLVTFLMMPIEIAWNATVSWQAGDFLCRLCSFCRIFGLYLSGFIIMCISIDRYNAVVHPLSILQSRQRAYRMLKAAWIFSFICSLPQFAIFHLESHPVFEWYKQCVTYNSFPSPQWELVYYYFGFVCLYGLPFCTILVCYMRMSCEIWKINARKRLQEHLLRSSSSENLKHAKSRTLFLTIMIVLTFFFCWTPYNVMSLWYWIDSESASMVDQRVRKGLFLFACTNSCVNPLIYGLFHFSRKQRRTPVNKRESEWIPLRNRRTTMVSILRVPSLERLI